MIPACVGAGCGEAPGAGVEAIAGEAARDPEVAGRGGATLRGRRVECEALDGVLAMLRAGRSQVLVLRGEPGVGKTALLDHLAGAAHDCRLARVTGVDSEMQLAYAGLHQLCAPFFARLQDLPGPQRDALASAFGLREPGPPDRFLLGLGLLSLLSSVAAERPLVCTVDDAESLDRESVQALAFAIRHLVGEPIAIVFATTPHETPTELGGLPELVIGGLSERHARALLRSAITGPLDEQVLSRIVVETRGNPGALLEVSGGRTPEQLGGGLGLLAHPAPAGPREESFRRRLARLPEPSRMLLLVAAAEAVLDPITIWRAAERLAIGPEAADAAVAEGILESGGQVRFCDPLARSAVYRTAAPGERQLAHRALAEVADPVLDSDRCAWHRALAARGLDEDAAEALERTAGRARARGGLAAAAAFQRMAAELTADPAVRGERALAAAEAKHRVGASDVALRMLAMVDGAPSDERRRLRAQLLRARIAADCGEGRDAPALLLAAARRLETVDRSLARCAYADALSAALAAGRLGQGCGPLEVARAVRAAGTGGSPAGPADQLLDGLTAVMTEGCGAGAPRLAAAVRAAGDGAPSIDDAPFLVALLCRSAQGIWDERRWLRLSRALVESARGCGALGTLGAALRSAALARLLAGEIDAARSMADEADATARVIGAPARRYPSLAIAAWRGREVEVTHVIAASMDDMSDRGEGEWLTAAEWASAVLYNGLGRYHEALLVAERAAAQELELGWATLSLAELVEAAVRAGKPERAAAALDRLGEHASASDSDWARGLEARSHALVSAGDEADRLHREAIERLAGTSVRTEHARAHLLYGEWLRRERRRIDARDQLRTAHEMLASMGLDAFAERARRELLATGETVRRRSVETRDDLTAQEAQIAKLAGDGRTNPEIGAELFLSPRTVEWHLRKVFMKLGISSRKELLGVLATDAIGLGA